MEIYITDLASYNSGNLVGEWVSLPMDETDLNTKIQEILQRGSEIDGYGETHEEYFITDLECDYYDVDEYENISTLNKMAQSVENLSNEEKNGVKFLLENHLVNNFEEALEKYEDVIIHEDMTMEDIAYNFVNECYSLENLAPIIANNIDYEKIGRELEIDGSYFQIGSDIYEYIG